MVTDAIKKGNRLKFTGRYFSTWPYTHRWSDFSLLYFPFYLFCFETLSKWWHESWCCCAIEVWNDADMLQNHVSAGDWWLWFVFISPLFFLLSFVFRFRCGNVCVCCRVQHLVAHWLRCNTRILLTRGNHLRRDTYTVFALDDFEFDAPFGVPSLDCDRIAIDPMLDDPNDEWFANFSNWIPLPKWIPPYCDDIDRMDAPNVVLMITKTKKEKERKK